MTLLRARNGALLILLALLLAACDSGEDPAPATQTQTAPATPSPVGTPPPTATAAPEPTATPSPPRPTGVMLIDTDSGAADTLYTGESFPSTRGFEADGSLWIAIASENRSLHFDAEGVLIEETEGYRTGEEPRCTRLPGEEPRAEIEGNEYPVTCGVFSPDGLRMLYFIDVESSDQPEGEYEAWVLDLDSDRTLLLQDGLRHCGGCDGRAGPSWSPAGWYVIFGETYGGEDSTVYLADVELGDTTVLAQGSNVNDAGSQPQWSPIEDALIAPSEDGWTQMIRPADDTTTRIEVPWPARFDESGAFVYSYAVRGDPFALGSDTTIASVEDGAIVATWPSRPQYVWPEPRGVTSIDGEPAALLEGCSDLKDECDPAAPCINGTAIYHPALDEPHCLEQTLGAEWSPDHAQVAASRRTAEGDIPYPPPYSEAWEIVLYDLDAGAERVLVSEIRPPGGEPPRLYWSPDGTRLLVQWPRPSGL